ncbi:MAG: L,D-transpeptidase [Hyphomicrobiaceae bacterium]|nr:L,D-transpeptidase [Hyphomicrobiaceae bacterium]
MNRLLLAGIATLALSVTAIGQGAEAGSLKVSIDLSKQRMTVKEDGDVVHSWPISSGRAGYRTVTGTFKPQWMTKMHYSRKYDDAPMPNAIFFHGGFAIHGTYATGRLGSPASHGCVRLSPGNAKQLYALVEEHGRGSTTISVYGTARDVAPKVATTKRSKAPRYASTYDDDEDAVVVKSRRSQAKQPKVIYRNGVPYVYVGREAARRYYAKRSYTSSNY